MKNDFQSVEEKILEFLRAQNPELDFTSVEIQKKVGHTQSSTRAAIAHLLNEEILFVVSKERKGKGFLTPHYRLRRAEDPAPLFSRYREPGMRIYKVPVRNGIVLVDPLGDLSNFEVNHA